MNSMKKEETERVSNTASNRVFRVCEQSFGVPKTGRSNHVPPNVLVLANPVLAEARGPGSRATPRSFFAN